MHTASERGLGVSMIEHGYGKSGVKLLYINRANGIHSIRECEVTTTLILSTVQSYLTGDNDGIIATDSQKNTVYILAKKHGIKAIENFAQFLCQHFLTTYKQVEEVQIEIKDYPWNRISSENQEHSHAFIFTPTATRKCKVSQNRQGEIHIESGFDGLRVLKTTKSAFYGFVHDEFTCLPDVTDRIFSTVVSASWKCKPSDKNDYDKIWHSAQACILEKFAGPPAEGIPSPSVQYTLYRAAEYILEKNPEVLEVRIVMPNKHYFPFDLSKFPEHLVQSEENSDVFLPVDKPSGSIHATLQRSAITAKL
nr:PREDICTED: uricase [Bemisia tabaci]